MRHLMFSTLLIALLVGAILLSFSLAFAQTETPTVTPSFTPTAYVPQMSDVPMSVEALPAVRQTISIFVLAALVYVFYKYFRR